MSSCPWTDYIDGDDETLSNATELILLSTSIPLFEDNAKKFGLCEVLIRSILLRAQYGGMAGDMKMLHGYARLWNERFSENNVPTSVAQKATAKPNRGAKEELSWIGILTTIHERPTVQSFAHVSPLIQHGLEKLTLPDICLAGVDFHCTSVLDQAISDEADYKRCYEGLCATAVQAGLSPLPAQKDRQRAHLLQIMKSCMWKFSSGVNHRRPLVREKTATKSAEGKEEALKSFWNENVAKPVEKYMNQYVGDRLSR
jgi:hypothetical protein